MGSVCALHISPGTWNDTMNNGIKTRYQNIVDDFSKKLPKCTNNLLKLGNLEKTICKALSEVYHDYIAPVEEQFVAYLTNYGLDYRPLGNLSVYDILEGKLNGLPEEKIRKYPDIENASWSCMRLGNEEIDIYVITTLPLPMYVNPNLTTAYMGDKGWGVLESVKAKYQQPAIITGSWLNSLQPDPQDLAPVFGIISYDQLNKWRYYLGNYIVKHSDAYRRKGIRTAQVKLSSNPDEKYITKISTKKRRRRKPDINPRLRQMKLF